MREVAVHVAFLPMTMRGMRAPRSLSNGSVNATARQLPADFQCSRWSLLLTLAAAGFSPERVRFKRLRRSLQDIRATTVLPGVGDSLPTDGQTRLCARRSERL